MNGNELIEKRCKRAIAVILGMKEREVDKHLPPEVSFRLRKVVIDTLNEFATMAIDVLDCSTTPSILNELANERLAEIHAAVVAK